MVNNFDLTDFDSRARGKDVRSVKAESVLGLQVNYYYSLLQNIPFQKNLFTVLGICDSCYSCLS